MKRILFIISSIVLHAAQASAQSIEITSVSALKGCSGDSVTVGYAATGSFTSKNSFTVQLSDPSGSFENGFKNLGSLRTTGSGVIRFAIPSTIASSETFKLRMIASEPEFEGEPFGTSVTYGTTVRTSLIVGGTQNKYKTTFLVGDTVWYHSSQPPGVSLYWEFGSDAIPQTSAEQNAYVVFTTPGTKSPRLTATSIAGCASITELVGHNSVEVFSCFPRIPANASVDSVEGSFASDHVWVVPGGKASLTGPHNKRQVAYVEPGGTLAQPSYDFVAYVKWGGAIEGSGSGRIIYEDGASLTGQDHGLALKCDDLEFDYSVAPPYKMQQASVRSSSASQFSISPNPASDLLTISGNSRIKHVNIRNALGAVVLRAFDVDARHTTLSVHDLAEGVYFVEILSDTSHEVRKIVVQR